MMDDLDDLLARAAQNAPAPSPALLARIAADALREQPRPVAAAPRPRPAPRGGWGFALADILGGSRGMAGLTLAAVSGLWIGVAQPAALSSVTDYLTGTASVELFPSDGSLLAGE